VIAVEGNFAYSFILGVMAAINPCGFVLLPTYLVYYLGTEINRGPESRAATLRRGLSVGTAVSAGFVGLFLVVGIISRAFTNTIVTHSKYASLVIGIALVAMGIAMFLGWKPPIAQPNISVQRQRTVWNMFLFGIVYAIASIGCTIGFLTSVILGSINRQGYVSGVLSITLYGLGMGLLVTSLTVALAFARVGLVKSLKKGFRWFDRVSAGFVTLTGVYLSWYWFSSITDRGANGIITRVDSVQTRVAEFLNNIGAPMLAIIFGLIVGVAVFFIRRPVRDNQS
jgi:cytochrome c biogenesis protein CcdA